MVYSTAASKQISTTGGYNGSEFNIQDHRPTTNNGVNFSEQRRSHQRFAGRNPLNPPGCTDEKRPLFGKLNEAYGWREQTLQATVPAQVPPRERTFVYQSSFDGEPERYHMPRAIRHGFASNDPTLAHLLDERQLAPRTYASHWSQADPELHSNVGIPSTPNQNMLDRPTFNRYPEDKKTVKRGNHDHHNMLEDRKPEFRNESSVSSGSHPTQGHHHAPVSSGMMMSEFRFDRPLMLSDLAPPPQPPIYATT